MPLNLDDAKNPSIGSGGEVVLTRYFKEEIQEQQFKRYILLAHELIHAQHAITGTLEDANKNNLYEYYGVQETQTYMVNYTGKYSTRMEEIATTGYMLVANNNSKYVPGSGFITENLIRLEHGLPMRPKY